MGVTGLWTVVQPCARPIKIETLNKKRLAVDASIWIYQFLKAVRDKEGNALRNSHVVGFFRRICKLLYFGIKPVFVFDGGAPALKRQTIASRKRRREGRREDAARTAGKLLALQMHRRAEEEEQRRKRGAQHLLEESEPLPENFVYAEELRMTPQERQQNRKFKKKDQYHLPDLDVSLAEMGGPNDPRIMSLEELEQYARSFDRGEDINVYDFSKIDFDSPFFISLPPSDRYNILNAARLRSRLRMGYSKDQLDSMFPDRMAFSKFQIERVRERNELTQRLMNINGMGDDSFLVNGSGRVAGDKDREYVLVKNDGVEGGWALGVVTSKDEGQKNKPIDVERLDEPAKEEEDDWEDEEEFEDVPIEGLNRLPKPHTSILHPARPQSKAMEELSRRRQEFYKSRMEGGEAKKPRQKEPSNHDPESLFLAESDSDTEKDWEHTKMSQTDDLFEDNGIPADEEEQLQLAIQMSLQKDKQDSEEEDNDDDFQEVFEQPRVENAQPFSTGSGLAIARMANARSSTKMVKQVPTQPLVSSDSEDDAIDLQAALVESKKSKYQGTSNKAPMQPPVSSQNGLPNQSSATEVAKALGFDGPLPFEKLDLGTSLLGRKKMQKLAEEAAGGFEKDDGQSKKKPAAPLPPWFKAGDVREDMTSQKAATESITRRREMDALRNEAFEFQELPNIRNRNIKEIIDLEAPIAQHKPIIGIDSSDDEAENLVDVRPEQKVPQDTPSTNSIILDMPPSQPETKASSEDPQRTTKDQERIHQSEDEPIEWEESDHEVVTKERATSIPRVEEIKSPNPEASRESKSPSPEFEDVDITSHSPVMNIDILDQNLSEINGQEDQPPVELEQQEMVDGNADDEHYFSDLEDDALLEQLAAEEEEHARFASILNNKTQEENMLDYEQELKALRNQQKKDRRDADEVTQAMITECQQLLTLFGLPYITAPMEAEAQCAELVSLGLVDGIVTDDSDIFLFGGTRVYKNMFSQAKFVECYLTSDLESEFTLTRQKLIAIAQLLGSDYTEGLPGVGPVTALEILSEFDTLRNFRSWWDSVQNGSLQKSADALFPFRRRFRRSHATKLFLSPSFPDARVEDAYLHPEVDSDPSSFVWGVPNLDALRGFLMATIGWDRERTDEVLVPVIRDMNKREIEGTQSNITQFVSGSIGAGAFAPRRKEQGKSKRLETALGKIAEKARRTLAEVDLAREDVDRQPKATATVTENSGTKRRKGKRTGGGGASVNPDNNEQSNEDEDAEYTEPRKRAKRAATRGRAKK